MLRLGVKQTTGTSRIHPMSQKAVTILLDIINNIGGGGNIQLSTSLNETVQGKAADATLIKYLNDSKYPVIGGGAGIVIYPSTVETLVSLGFSLAYANLDSASLDSASLYGASLYGANLTNATLINANLVYANLSYADLSYTDLRNANLLGANLSNTSFSSTYLDNANLTNAIIGGCSFNMTSANVLSGVGRYDNDFMFYDAGAEYIGIWYWYDNSWHKLGDIFYVNDVLYLTTTNGCYPASDYHYGETFTGEMSTITNGTPISIWISSNEFANVTFTDIYFEGNLESITGDGVVRGAYQGATYIGTDGNTYQCWVA